MESPLLQGSVCVPVCAIALGQCVYRGGGVYKGEVGVCMCMPKGGVRGKGVGV